MPYNSEIHHKLQDLVYELYDHIRHRRYEEARMMLNSVEITGEVSYSYLDCDEITGDLNSHIGDVLEALLRNEENE